MPLHLLTANVRAFDLAQTDGLVWLHDLSSLSLSSQLTQTKGALTFALDTSVQRQLPLSHSPGGSIRSSKQSTVYRPSTGTLPRTRTSTSISSRVPGASGGWQAASLRGMEALVKEKEEREKRVKEGLDAEGEFSEEEGAVMTLVTVLAVGCRRKVILFRWVDGEFWDTKVRFVKASPKVPVTVSPALLIVIASTLWLRIRKLRSTTRLGPSHFHNRQPCLWAILAQTMRSSPSQ